MIDYCAPNSNGQCSCRKFGSDPAKCAYGLTVAWYVKATGAFHLNYDRITANEFLLGVTELREPYGN